MKRAFVLAGILTAAVLASVSEADACGDKSLAAGGIRMQRAIAARYPASILLYVPSSSRLPGATRELKLQETLRGVGHTYREVATWPELQAAVDSGQFNVILADVADVSELKRHFASVPSRIAVIPVAYKLTKAESDEIKKQRGFVIKAPSGAAQYLTTIANAVRSTGSTPRKG
jgi:hypothetical protein